MSAVSGNFLNFGIKLAPGVDRAAEYLITNDFFNGIGFSC